MSSKFRGIFFLATIFLLVTAVFGSVRSYAQTSTSAILVLPDIVHLKALGAASHLYPQVYVKGYNSTGDGGGGQLYWDNSNTTPGTICGPFQATGVSTGRWLWMNTGLFSIKQCGGFINGASAADNGAAMVQAPLSINGLQTILLPCGSNGYSISTSISIPHGGANYLGCGKEQTTLVRTDTSSNNNFTVTDTLGHLTIQGATFVGNNTSTNSSNGGFIYATITGAATSDMTHFTFRDIGLLNYAADGWARFQVASTVFRGSISGTTMTITSAPVNTIVPGQNVSAGTIAAACDGTGGSNLVTLGTTVVSQISGTTGGVGTYQISASQSVGLECLYISTQYNISDIHFDNIYAKSFPGNSRVPGVGGNPSSVLYLNGAQGTSTTGGLVKNFWVTNSEFAIPDLKNLLWVDNNSYNVHVVHNHVTSVGSQATQATFTASISGTIMTVSAVAGSATIFPRNMVVGVGVNADTTIVSQLTGSPGNTGTYLVSVTQTVGSEAMTSVDFVAVWSSTIGVYVGNENLNCLFLSACSVDPDQVFIDQLSVDAYGDRVLFTNGFNETGHVYLTNSTFSNQATTTSPGSIPVAGVGHEHAALLSISNLTLINPWRGIESFAQYATSNLVVNGLWITGIKQNGIGITLSNDIATTTGYNSFLQNIHVDSANSGSYCFAIKGNNLGDIVLQNFDFACKDVGMAMSPLEFGSAAWTRFTIMNGIIREGSVSQIQAINSLSPIFISDLISYRGVLTASAHDIRFKAASASMFNMTNIIFDGGQAIDNALFDGTQRTPCGSPPCGVAKGAVSGVVYTNNAALQAAASGLGTQAQAASASSIGLFDQNLVRSELGTTPNKYVIQGWDTLDASTVVQNRAWTGN